MSNLSQGCQALHEPEKQYPCAVCSLCSLPKCLCKVRFKRPPCRDFIPAEFLFGHCFLTQIFFEGVQIPLLKMLRHSFTQRHISVLWRGCQPPDLMALLSRGDPEHRIHCPNCPRQHSHPQPGAAAILLFLRSRAGDGDRTHSLCCLPIPSQCRTGSCCCSLISLSTGLL